MKPAIELGIYEGSRFTEPIREVPKDRKLEFNYVPFPFEYIDQGLMGVLKHSAFMVFMSFCRHVDWFTGEGYIYHEQIVKETGVNKNYISKAIKNIVKYKLITIHAVNKRGHYIKFSIPYYKNKGQELI